ncbi:MAG: ABC transporter substrate-binding protein [Desulfobacterales bacterium]
MSAGRATGPGSYRQHGGCNRPRGICQYLHAHPEFFRGIEKIETPDDSTLVVTLKDVDALFIAHMAEGDAVMLPQKGYENAASEPVGTGPFKFVKWVRGDRVEMARNEKYWNPALPYLDKVTFKFIGDASAQIAALKAGDIDVIGYIAAPEQASEMAKDKRFKVYAGTTTSRSSCPPITRKNPSITNWCARPWPMPSTGRPLSTW